MIEDPESGSNVKRRVVLLNNRRVDKFGMRRMRKIRRIEPFGNAQITGIAICIVESEN